jgi:parallel beta-helix repeat protein
MSRMNRALGSLVFVAVASLTASSSLAATRFVRVGGADVGDCTSATPGCATITYAVSQAVAGDTIDVGIGTFTEPTGIVINKQLILHGAQAGVDARTRTVPPDPVTETIITQTLRVLADGVVIDGFTIMAPVPDPSLNAGIHTSNANSGEQILNNIVTNNTIGVYLQSNGTSPVLVQHNHIFDDNAQLGVAPSAGNGLLSDAGLVNATIDANLFSGSQNSQILLIGAGPNVQITNNDFPLDGATTADDSNPVNLFQSTGITVANNTISNSPFSGIVLTGSDSNITIMNNTITGGLSTAVNVLDAQFLATPSPNGANIQILSNTLVGNVRGISISSPGVPGTTTPIEAHFNRIVNNSTANIVTNDATDVVNAQNNWFGCNAGPNTACGGAVTTFPGSTLVTTPFLVLSIAASPTAITIGGTSSVTADLNHNSAGVDVSGLGHVPDVTPIAFTATGGTLTTPTPTHTTNGAATVTFTGTAVGTGTVTATVDAQPVTANITVGAAASTVTLTSSVNPSNFGSPVTFTATVPAGATGTVQFTIDGVASGSPVTIVGNTASITVSNLSVGTHTVVANFSGDATFAPSSSAPLTQTVLATAAIPTLSGLMLLLLAASLGLMAVALQRRT